MTTRIIAPAGDRARRHGSGLRVGRRRPSWRTYDGGVPLDVSVEVVESERNLGFGGGHNLLAGRHDAAALLVLNPDAQLVEPRTVERLLAAPRGGAVGGR